jgi:hypothetical protein
MAIQYAAHPIKPYFFRACSFLHALVSRNKVPHTKGRQEVPAIHRL